MPYSSTRTFGKCWAHEQAGGRRCAIDLLFHVLAVQSAKPRAGSLVATELCESRSGGTKGLSSVQNLAVMRNRNLPGGTLCSDSKQPPPAGTSACVCQWIKACALEEQLAAPSAHPAQFTFASDSNVQGRRLERQYTCTAMCNPPLNNRRSLVAQHALSVVHSTHVVFSMCLCIT